jgi:hypothetical protein
MSTTTATRPAPLIHSSNSLRQTASKKSMSITQTYYLAHKARAKLSREAAQSDHDLRLLVGHANLLDSLMLELADAEREQERWFNQSVRGASPAKTQDRHVQWADRIVEEEAEEQYDSDSDSSDSDDEYEINDIEMANAPAHKVHDDEMEEDDLEEDYAQLELVRTPSHSSPPPELIDHDSESSDDESTMPPSPPQPVLAFSEKGAKETESQQEESNSFYDEKYYLPARNPARLVSAISVY